jgi:DNA-binding response OmpR family regulator
MKKRILVVDDNQHLLTTLGDYLEFEGFEVAIATDGEEALRQIGIKAPALILLDMCMPGMGGISFLKAISEENGNLKYPVIVLTAKTTMEDFFKTLPVEAFMAKPCSEADLVRKIRTVLAAKEGRPLTAKQTGQRILIAESDAAFATNLKNLLAGYGHYVQVVASGPDVLEHAIAFHPNLILMNEVLPMLNGVATVSVLKAMASVKDVPIIMYDEAGSELTAKVVNRIPNGVAKLLHTSNANIIVDAVTELFRNT